MLRTRIKYWFWVVYFDGYFGKTFPFVLCERKSWSSIDLSGQEEEEEKEEKSNRDEMLDWYCFLEENVRARWRAHRVRGAVGAGPGGWRARRGQRWAYRRVLPRCLANSWPVRWPLSPQECNRFSCNGYSRLVLFLHFLFSLNVTLTLLAAKNGFAIMSIISILWKFPMGFVFLFWFVVCGVLSFTMV